MVRSLVVALLYAPGNEFKRLGHDAAPAGAPRLFYDVHVAAGNALTIGDYDETLYGPE